jgi:membrane-associated phospholipid phosphatase
VTRETSGRVDRAARHRAELLLLASAAVLLVISALPAQNDRISGAERTVFHWINDLPGFLYGPLAVVMQLGNLLTVFLAAVVALLFRRYRLAIGIAVAGLAAYLLAKVIKNAVARGRPADLLDDVHLRGAHVGGLGFVSGHSAVAFAIVTVVTMWLDRPARIVLWCLAATVAIARIYVGAHLPLDVVGGAALGISCGAVVRLLIGARRHGRGSAGSQQLGRTNGP